MKRLIYLLIVFMSIGIISGCGKTKSQMIIGKWKIADVVSPEPNFEGYPDSVKAQYKQQMDIKNKILLSTGYYEFLQGDSSVFENDGLKYEGKWRLNDEQDKIFLREKGSPAETAFEIKEISESIFIIESTLDGKLLRMVMRKEVN